MEGAVFGGQIGDVHHGSPALGVVVKRPRRGRHFAFEVVGAEADVFGRVSLELNDKIFADNAPNANDEEITAYVFRRRL